MRTSAIGIMSGTSLDGLDLAFCHFIYDGKWHFEITKTAFIGYDEAWRHLLATAHRIPKTELQELDIRFGKYIAQQVNRFLAENRLPKPDLVCSHGHTVFHDPSKKYTLQIGSGRIISEETGLNCVSDFRSLDVALGGQGAPLVPIGDALLFSQFEACLNLGGFSNISFREAEKRVAFDICPVNIALNPLAELLGKPFDRNGEMARSGNIETELLHQLNSLSIYNDANRPSLSREWLEKTFLPLIKNSAATTHDKLRTLTEHSAQKIAAVINANIPEGQILITGGGAKNGFLMERISTLSHAKIIIPSSEIIDFKEALIFAFLGVLRWHDKINVLSSVTGSERDSSSGIIHVGTNGNTPSIKH
ncbi:MAG: anhydro-N-acetylmuramic acid kinase [Flavobacteriales bacterium]|nr:anhydro-N-acetylmuramic acid kinase [Flavobacteriales bacterium]